GTRITSGGGPDLGRPGEVKLWDAQTGQETLTLQGHTEGVRSVAFSPDAKRIVSGSQDGTVKVWDATTGQEALTLLGRTDDVDSVAVSVDGKRILSGGSGGPKRGDARLGQSELRRQGLTRGRRSLRLT